MQLGFLTATSQISDSNKVQHISFSKKKMSFKLIHINMYPNNHCKKIASKLVKGTGAHNFRWLN